MQTFTQDLRFPTYCPGGTQPDPKYHYTVDEYSTINVEEITINKKLSWYCAGNVSDPCDMTDSLHPHRELLAVRPPAAFALAPAVPFSQTTSCLCRHFAECCRPLP